jgi:dimeric dUTPase (all-alpha-NTP-PPase superfamily)
MMNDLDLTGLLLLQQGLDEAIASRHGGTYESTREKRLLALFVELGEFANETRCFKFWSLKGPSGKGVILDEYADGMHFFLSLGLALKVTGFTHELKTPSKELTEAILQVYEDVGDLSKEFTPAHYFAAFGAYLDLLPLLGYSGEEAIAAYRKKLAVNYQRQEEHY